MMEPHAFTEYILQRGDELYRPMPWRTDTRAYYILVSELMLQQTQVARVMPKFEAFIAAFPDTKTLAAASLSDVLVLWNGLGYNRRAKFLHEAARMVEQRYGGVMPTTAVALQTLPGVGVNTAGAIMTYAYNQLEPFIETNVRTVYIHHFFANETQVDDTHIRTLLEATIPPEHPREFYWALMDYGTYLKANGVRNVAKSKHYKKQSALEGSVRQMRGRLVRQLSAGEVTMQRLLDEHGMDQRFSVALEGLQREGLIEIINDTVRLTK